MQTLKSKQQFDGFYINSSNSLFPYCTCYIMKQWCFLLMTERNILSEKLLSFCTSSESLWRWLGPTLLIVKKCITSHAYIDYVRAVAPTLLAPWTGLAYRWGCVHLCMQVWCVRACGGECVRVWGGRSVSTTRSCQGHGPVLGHGLGVGDPCVRGCVKELGQDSLL